MRERWRVRRGWIKVHTMIDLEAGQIFGPEVTDESILDDSLFTPLWIRQNPSVAQSTISTGCSGMYL